MEKEKHYLMTCLALLFLGLILAKPGASFSSSHLNRECKLVKGRMNCEAPVQEYQLNMPVVHYHYK